MQAPREYHSFVEMRQALAGRLDRADRPRLFDRLDWMEALHRHCFPDMPLRMLSVSAAQGDAWLFLLAPAPGRLRALANYYSFAWAPIFTGAVDAATQQQMLTTIARHLRARCSRIDLYPIEDGAALSAALRRAGWWTVRRAMGGRHLLPLRGRDFAAYWADRPGRLRNLVRRKGRGSPFALSIHDQLTPRLWDDYVDVQARSWQGPEPARGTAFLRALAERESAAGTLRLGFARAQGRAVATQLWTIEAGVALIHKLAHDRAFDAQSPGTLLSHAMFAQAIDRDGATLIDYGTGDNDYKADWMEQRLPLYRIDAFNPRSPASWLPAARAAISALVG